MKTLVPLVVLLALASSVFAAEPKREDQVDDICEAVFRSQIGLEPAGEQKNSPAFFLAVAKEDFIVSSFPGRRNLENLKGLDPSDAFMKRFADLKQPVRKCSRCDMQTAVDKVTGEQGVLLGISTITWKSDLEVEVRSTAARGPSLFAGNSCTLKKENGKWAVTESRKLWVTKAQ